MVIKWECPICRDDNLTTIPSCLVDVTAKTELHCPNCKSVSELTMSIDYKEETQ